MNTDVVKGKWTQIKADLQKTWGKITDDEWEQTKGEASAVSGLIQERYGRGKDEVSEQIADLYEKHIAQNKRPPSEF